jgi:hypothetical protein
LFYTIFFTVILAILGVCPAGANGPGAYPIPWEPSRTMGPILTDNAVPTPTGEWVLQAYGSLSLVRGDFTASGRRRSAGGDFTSLEIPVKVTYGLAPNLEVYLTGTFIDNWAGGVEGRGQPGGSASFGGLGDIFVAAKYQVVAETANLPTVSALLSVNFPTGHHYRLNPARLGTDALGEGVWAITGGFNLSKWLGPVYLYANLWYSLPTRDPGVVNHQQTGPLLFAVDGRDQITWNLAAEWVLTPRWIALLEFYSTWDVGPLFRASQAPRSNLLGVLPGVEYIINEHWSGAVGVAVDLAGKTSFASCTPICTVLVKF